MAHLLGAEALHLAYPDRVVFGNVTLGLDDGDRIGVVGRNGAGKSSLLSLLSGSIAPHEGRVTRRRGVQMGVLGQRDSLNDADTVGQAIVGQRLDYEWAAHARTREIIANLAADIPWQAPVATLSGGQRRRVALAALLAEDWDIIALDEPTNHLDLEGISWLARHLRGRWPPGRGALLLVTHDRWLLDEVTTRTWEVHDGHVSAFEGGYAAWVLQRVERDRLAAAAEAKRQNQLRKELAWLRRGAPARTSKPKFRIEAANDLISDVPPIRNEVQLTQLATGRLGKDVIDLLDVSVSFGDNEVLRDVTWRIAPGERTGILGANGAGKSTLLGLITGSLTPDEGRIKRGKTVQLASLDQEFSQLAAIGQDRVREVLARTKGGYVVDGKELTPTQLLERLNFDRAHLSTRVAELSGGQQRRLQLLLVLLAEPNVLVLDEPTNDVDTEMLTAMEDLLDSWPGTLIAVSHDRYLLQRVTDQQYAIINGHLHHLPGGIEEYLDVKPPAGARLASDSPLAAETTTRQGDSAATAAQGNATSETVTQPLSGTAAHAARRERGSIERRLLRVEKQVRDLEERLTAHNQGDYAEIQRLSTELRDRQHEVSDLEERWLELSEQLG